MLLGGQPSFALSGLPTHWLLKGVSKTALPQTIAKGGCASHLLRAPRVMVH